MRDERLIKDRSNVLQFAGTSARAHEKRPHQEQKNRPGKQCLEAKTSCTGNSVMPQLTRVFVGSIAH